MFWIRKDQKWVDDPIGSSTAGVVSTGHWTSTLTEIRGHLTTPDSMSHGNSLPLFSVGVDCSLKWQASRHERRGRLAVDAGCGCGGGDRPPTRINTRRNRNHRPLRKGERGKRYERKERKQPGRGYPSSRNTIKGEIPDGPLKDSLSNLISILLVLIDREIVERMLGQSRLEMDHLASESFRES